MVLRWLWRKVAGEPWPEDVPRLYPELGFFELCSFLSERDYRRLSRLTPVMVLPISAVEADPHWLLGVGLSRVLIRDLMLVPELSVRGPEDTPLRPLYAVPSGHPLARRNILIGGQATHDEEGFSAQLRIQFPDGEVAQRSARHRTLTGFIERCNHAALSGLGVGPDAETPEAWRSGRPAAIEHLLELARLWLAPDKLPGSRQAVQLWKANRDFGLALGVIDSEYAKLREYLVRGLERDPYDAQLCFSLFCAVWSGRAPQAEAVQFIRRALELSPGHGKAHMCAPHAAHPKADMLRHSELGYRLLPGNPFAVNNYALNLQRAGRPADDILELAYEGIQLDPEDPGNYEQAIDLLCELGDVRNAVKVAEELQSLYEPALRPRAKYCLEQNPERARLLRSGAWDPAAENRARIKELRRRAKGH